MQDITPILGEEIKVIKSYGDDSFTVNEEKFKSSIFIFQNKALAISAKNIDEIKLEDFSEFLEDIEILIIGFGETSDFLSAKIEKEIKSHGVKIEYMNSGAAARTYNVLITEERKVAAVIIAV